VLGDIVMINIEEKLSVKILPRFVPVIFANGEDDDAPGLQACFDDEAVQLDGRIHEPGETVEICGRHIVLTREVVASARGRQTVIDGCYIEPRGIG
jgi:hypothetical protein